MIKANFKKILIMIFGFRKYLVLVSIFRVATLRFTKVQQEFFYFLSMISPDGIILDIGANIGYTSYFLSKRGSAILAFEPIPQNKAVLDIIRTLFRLWNVKVFQMAIGNKNASVKMVMPVMENVFAHAYCHVTEYPEKENGEIFSVPQKRLDDIEEIKTHFNKDIKALKIDVEGRELSVLEGGENLLLRFRPLIFCEVQDSNRKQVFNFVRRLDYKVMKYIPSRLVAVLSDDQYFGNFIFVPGLIK